MKITRQQLRKLIREMAWDPKTSPHAHPSYVYSGESPRAVRRTKDYQDYLDDEDNSSVLRALGLLSAETAEKEKQILRDYHEKNQAEIKKFYTELVKLPELAQVTCLHSISYDGAFTNTKGETVSEWIKKFGRSGKDQLSAVMFPCSITELYEYFIGGFKTVMDSGSNSAGVIRDISLILSGYPVMMNYRDMMTQTRGNLHPELVKFQIGSGTSKSSGKTPDIVNFKQFLKNNTLSEETVLDNWEIKGVHYSINLDMSRLDPETQESINNEQNSLVKSLTIECQNLNIPLWITDAANMVTNRVV